MKPPVFAFVNILVTNYVKTSKSAPADKAIKPLKKDPQPHVIGNQPKHSRWAETYSVLYKPGPNGAAGLKHPRMRRAQHSDLQVC